MRPDLTLELDELPESANGRQAAQAGSLASDGGRGAGRIGRAQRVTVVVPDADGGLVDERSVEDPAYRDAGFSRILEDGADPAAARATVHGLLLPGAGCPADAAPELPFSRRDAVPPTADPRIRDGQPEN